MKKLLESVGPPLDPVCRPGCSGTWPPGLVEKAVREKHQLQADRWQKIMRDTVFSYKLEVPQYANHVTVVGRTPSNLNIVLMILPD